MFKILAAARPLSVQVHPSAEIARAGFEAEQSRGGARSTIRARTYKDPNHKPEMAYALTTFDSLVGFRPTAEILRILHGLDVPLAQRLADELTGDPGFAGIVRLVEDVLSGGATPRGRRRDRGPAAPIWCGRGHRHQAGLRHRASRSPSDHPGDPGIVIALLLNRLTLQPGEAAFLGDGIIHAHLRACAWRSWPPPTTCCAPGLTSKPLDPVGLVECLDVGMSRLARVTPVLFGASTDVFAPDVREFALAVGQCSTGEPGGIELPPSEQRILVCTGGDVQVVNAAGEQLSLSRGQSMYAGPEDGTLRVMGVGEVAQAYLPPPDDRADAAALLVDLV